MSLADELPAFDSSISRIAHYSGTWSLGDLGSAVIGTNGQFSTGDGCPAQLAIGERGEYKPFCRGAQREWRRLHGDRAGVCLVRISDRTKQHRGGMVRRDVYYRAESGKSQNDPTKSCLHLGPRKEYDQFCRT